LDFHEKMLAAGGVAVAASVRRDQGLPCAGHIWFQLTPACPLQDTVESISQVGGTSGKPGLRRGKMLQSNVRSEAKKKMRESYRGSTKVSEEGRKGSAPCARAGIPLQPVERTMLQQISILQSMENPTPGQMDIPCRRLQWMESPCRSRFS